MFIYNKHDDKKEKNKIQQEANKIRETYEQDDFQWD